MNSNDVLRVFLVTNRFAPSKGGIERQCGLLAHAFVERGMKVTVLTDRFRPDLRKFEQIDGINVRRVWSLWTMRKPLGLATRILLRERAKSGPTSSAWGNTPAHRNQGLPMKLRLRRILSYRIPMYTLCLSVLIVLIRRRKEYDVIQVFQTNLLAVAAVIAGRITGKPVIARDAVSGGMDELTEFLFPRSISSMVARNCTFISLSRHIEQDLLGRGIPPTRVVRIPNSVQLPQILSEAEPKPNTVLFVGNVSGDFRQKGLDILFKAWKIVISEIPESRLTVVGGGDFASFETLAAEDGIRDSVDFAGLQENIGPWYEKAGMFVLPSRYEGMSNALLEAMSFGKACVVTNISGSDDLIEHEMNGLKVSSEEPEGLAGAIIELFKNPAKAKTLGRNARASVENHNAPSRIAEQYAAIYRKVVDDGVSR